MLEQSLRINPEIEKIIADKGIDRNVTIMALTGIQYGDENALNQLLDSDLLNETDEHIIRLHLLNRNHADESYEMRVPLFSVVEPGEYEQFVTSLIEENLGSYGLPENTLRYTVFSDDDELRRSYDYCKLRLGKEFDQDKLVEVVITYYRHCESPKGMARYLRENVEIDYRNGNTNG